MPCLYIYQIIHTCILRTTVPSIEPFHSSFRLWDSFEALIIPKDRLTNAEHDFLSSRHGAATDIQGNPDEVIHLAATLQFCGYTGVKGTLWEMLDADGPSTVEDFYDYMFREAGSGRRVISSKIVSTQYESQEYLVPYTNCSECTSSKSDPTTIFDYQQVR
jgi:hypothetical protein